MELEGPQPHQPTLGPRERLVPTPQRPALLWGDSLRFPNIFYRSGFLAPDEFAVVDDGTKVTVWVSPLEANRARLEVKPGVVVRSTTELIYPMALRQRAHQIGADSASVHLAAICHTMGVNAVVVDRNLGSLEAVELRDLGIDVAIDRSMYIAARRIKNQAEIDAVAATMTAAQDATQVAIEMIRTAQIRNGILYRNGRPLSGQDLVVAVEQRLLELGCGAEQTICCGGPDNADGHRATSPVLRAGLPIVLDIFPYHKQTRMWGDMTRTVVRGTPKPEVLKMWNAVHEAQATALAAVKPGVTGAQLHKIACDVFKKHGYASDTAGYETIASTARFIHSLGHGVGLQVHEPPGVGAHSNAPLREGDVITIEPGLYDPKLGGIRIEDTVVVTKDGFRQLTPLPKVFEVDPPAQPGRRAA